MFFVAFYGLLLREEDVFLWLLGGSMRSRRILCCANHGVYGSSTAVEDMFSMMGRMFAKSSCRWLSVSGPVMLS